MSRGHGHCCCGCCFKLGDDPTACVWELTLSGITSHNAPCDCPAWNTVFPGIPYVQEVSGRYDYRTVWSPGSYHPTLYTHVLLEMYRGSASPPYPIRLTRVYVVPSVYSSWGSISGADIANACTAAFECYCRAFGDTPVSRRVWWNIPQKCSPGDIAAEGRVKIVRTTP